MAGTAGRDADGLKLIDDPMGDMYTCKVTKFCEDPVKIAPSRAIFLSR